MGEKTLISMGLVAALLVHPTWAALPSVITGPTRTTLIEPPLPTAVVLRFDLQTKAVEILALDKNLPASAESIAEVSTLKFLPVKENAKVPSQALLGQEARVFEPGKSWSFSWAHHVNFDRNFVPVPAWPQHFPTFYTAQTSIAYTPYFWRYWGGYYYCWYRR